MMPNAAKKFSRVNVAILLSWYHWKYNNLSGKNHEGNFITRLIANIGKTQNDYHQTTVTITTGRTQNCASRRLTAANQWLQPTLIKALPGQT